MSVKELVCCCFVVAVLCLLGGFYSVESQRKFTDELVTECELEGKLTKFECKAFAYQFINDR